MQTLLKLGQSLQQGIIRADNGRLKQGLWRRGLRARVGATEAFADALTQARHGLVEPRGFNRFEQVVHRALFKGSHCIFIVGSDEDELAAPVVQSRNLTRRFNARQARHANVQKHDIGPQFVGQLHRLQPIPGDAANVQIRPALPQARLQLLAQQALVVGNHCANTRACGWAWINRVRHGSIIRNALQEWVWGW